MPVRSDAISSVPSGSVFMFVIPPHGTLPVISSEMGDAQASAIVQEMTLVPAPRLVVLSCALHVRRRGH